MNKLSILKKLIELGEIQVARTFFNQNKKYFGDMNLYTILEEMIKHPIVFDITFFESIYATSSVKLPVELFSIALKYRTYDALIFFKSYVNSQNLMGQNALHIVFEESFTDFRIIEFLVDAGINLGATTYGQRETPLHVLLRKRQNIIVNTIFMFLVKNGAELTKLDGSRNSLLHLAVNQDHTDISEFLLRRHPELLNNSNSENILPHMLCRSIEMAFILNKRGVDWNYFNGEINCMHLFIQRHCNDVIMYINDNFKFENRADVNNNTYIHQALISENHDILSFILKEWPSDVNKVNREGYTPIFYAITNYNSCNFLLQNGADGTFIAGIHKQNILLQVIRFCNKNVIQDVMELFIKNGANIEHRDISGSSVMEKAIESKKKGAIVALIQAGVDLDKLDQNGRPLIYHGIRTASMETLELLIILGFDLTYLNETVLVWPKKTALSRLNKEFNLLLLLVHIIKIPFPILGEIFSYITLSENGKYSKNRSFYHLIDPSMNKNLY